MRWKTLINKSDIARCRKVRIRILYSLNATSPEFFILKKVENFNRFTKLEFIFSALIHQYTNDFCQKHFFKLQVIHIKICLV